MKKDIERLRAMDYAELIRELRRAKRELMELRFRKATGTLEKPDSIRKLRKEIARIKTILTEKRVSGNVNGR